MYEKRLSSSLIYDGKILKLYKDTVEVDNKTTVREIVKHNGGSAVFVEKDGKILFVRQFRYAYGEEILEIPAGKISLNEPPEETAIRELEEECGLVAKKVEKIFTVYPTPGYTTEILHVYVAKDLSQGKINLDEDEKVEPVWIDVETVKQMLKLGEIKDAKTIIALQHYFLNQ